MVLPIVTFAWPTSSSTCRSPATSAPIRCRRSSPATAPPNSRKSFRPKVTGSTSNIDQVPQHVRDAVMAAEDRDFYSNPGFSFSGFARAVKNNLFGGDTQGGSTITQQYVKNALVGSQRAGVGGLVRKAKELVIATKMSSEWSKDQVLQAYLNIIYFGRGAYGIAAASKAYFNKPVEQLTVADGCAAGRADPAAVQPRPGRRPARC